MGGQTIEVRGQLLELKAIKDSWAVGTLRVESSSNGDWVGCNLCVKGGRLGTVHEGVELSLRGHFEEHPRFGPQLEIEEQTSHGITNPLNTYAWLQRLDGVGPQLARRLQRKFGDRITEVLDADLKVLATDPLLEVDGVGSVKVRTIRESWGSLKSNADPKDLEYLDGIGLTRYEANNVLDWASKQLGDRSARELIQQQPWALIEVKGFGFRRADVVALKTGASKTSPARCDAAVVYQLDEETTQDTQVTLGQLLYRTVELIGVDATLVNSAIRRQAKAGHLQMRKRGAVRVCHPLTLWNAEQTVLRVLAPEIGAEEEPWTT